MFFRTLYITALIIGTLAEKGIDNVFRDTNVIPDMIDEAPKEKLKIEFENGYIVGDGNEFKASETETIPTIDWSSADPNKFYTLYMGCPDAPTAKNTIWREAIHWMVLNIPGNQVDKGDIHSTYVGPLASKNDGIFRYVYLVYEQSDKIPFDGVVIGENEFDARKGFKIRQFVKEYNLGQLVAGNVYRTQWDEGVQLQRNRLGMSSEE